MHDAMSHTGDVFFGETPKRCLDRIRHAGHALYQAFGEELIGIGFIQRVFEGRTARIENQNFHAVEASLAHSSTPNSARISTICTICPIYETIKVEADHPASEGAGRHPGVSEGCAESAGTGPLSVANGRAVVDADRP